MTALPPSLVSWEFFFQRQRDTFSGFTSSLFYRDIEMSIQTEVSTQLHFPTDLKTKTTDPQISHLKNTGGQNADSRPNCILPRHNCNFANVLLKCCCMSPTPSHLSFIFILRFSIFESHRQLLCVAVRVDFATISSKSLPWFAWNLVSLHRQTSVFRCCPSSTQQRCQAPFVELLLQFSSSGTLPSHVNNLFGTI